MLINALSSFMNNIMQTQFRSSSTVNCRTVRFLLCALDQSNDTVFRCIRVSMLGQCLLNVIMLLEKLINSDYLTTSFVVHT